MYRFIQGSKEYIIRNCNEGKAHHILYGCFDFCSPEVRQSIAKFITDKDQKDLTIAFFDQTIRLKKLSRH